MLDRIRRLNISLAAKCQLLFGAAVVFAFALDEVKVQVFRRLRMV